jgi:flagellar motor switch protein FliG
VDGLLKITGRETSVRKAAKFLMLIGRDEAGKVLRHFTEPEIEAITREIAGIRRIEAAEAEKLLAEFGFLKETLRYPSGGVETARRILVGAFGEEKGRDILQRSLPADKEKFFGYLEDFEPNQLYHLLRSESPAVLAVIFPYLSPEKASAVLPQFEPAFRRDLVARIARKEKIQREVLLRMDEALREKTRKLASPQDAREIDGKGILADILKYVDLAREEDILRRLEEESPVVAGEIKERLFTIDVLDYMEDEDLRKLLQGMDDRDIALLLKGKSDTIRAKMLSCMSERRRTFVAEEYKLLGPVPKKDVDAATKDFLALLRRLEEEGTIVFRREADRWVE